MRLHARHADGEYYTAEVVALVRGRAQVRFAGYDEVAWCAPSQLRSRALRGSRAQGIGRHASWRFRCCAGGGHGLAAADSSFEAAEIRLGSLRS